MSAAEPWLGFAYIFVKPVALHSAAHNRSCKLCRSCSLRGQLQRSFQKSKKKKAMQRSGRRHLDAFQFVRRGENNRMWMNKSAPQPGWGFHCPTRCMVISWCWRRSTQKSKLITNQMSYKRMNVKFTLTAVGYEECNCIYFNVKVWRGVTEEIRFWHMCSSVTYCICSCHEVSKKEKPNIKHMQSRPFQNDL